MNTVSQFPADLLVAVPAFNAEHTLGELLDRLTRCCPPGQVLVVDDGSSDNTEYLARNRGVGLLRHSSNVGKGAALRTSLRYAADRGFRRMVSIDADLQHPPEELAGFLEAGAGSRLVIGARRFSSSGMPFLRRISNTLTSAFVSLFCRRRIPDSQCGMRCYPVTETVRWGGRSDRFDYESETLVRLAAVGLLIESRPISTVYGPQESRIRHVSDTLRFIRRMWVWLWM